MSDEPEVTALGEHRYLIQVRQGEDLIEIRVYASPGIVDQLVRDEADEVRVVEATAGYLIARQRADDLPSQLDLDDVAAAYSDFVDQLRLQLDGSA